MTRIVSGTAGGRRLAVPPGRATRPTSDRAREGLFSAVEAMLGTLAGIRVLDLYSGSGAIGIEALSRGAGHALLVESNEQALRVIRANVRTVGLAGAEIAAVRVERLVASPPPGLPYDLVVADPPYDLPDDELAAILQGLASRGWAAPGALLAVERPTRGGFFRWPGEYFPDRSRTYGEATLWYGRAAPDEPPDS